MKVMQQAVLIKRIVPRMVTIIPKPMKRVICKQLRLRNPQLYLRLYSHKELTLDNKRIFYAKKSRH